MGGSQSQEFMVYTDAGEDLIASCPACGYAANIEKATSRLAPVIEMAPTGNGLPELVSTPGQAAIIDVTKFFDIQASSDIKCVAYMATIPAKSADKKSADGKSAQSQSLQPVVAFLRGDHFVNETKLLAVLGATELRTMQPEELETWLHGPAGYLGPVGLDPAAKINDGKLNVILDPGLQNRQNLVCGANKLDYHYRNVVPGRDFQWTAVAEIRNAAEGEGCPQCGQPLRVAKAVEVGHIFKLGNRYTDGMGVRVLDANGKEVIPIMGCYGIGIERILVAAIEQGNDANGFWLPPSIAPFDVVVTITNVADPALKTAGEKVAADLDAAGLDVLLDDRDERAGVKFKDADLIGIPYRVNVGKKAAEGKVELVTRATSSSSDVPIADIAAALKKSRGA
jgi:prolyl-tRNA synthetase